jgi:hypothetical protein
MMRRMKTYSSLIVACVVGLVIFGACQQKSAPQNEVENLPDLPPDLAATLDPNTMATKTPAVNPSPAKPPDVLFAPCCASTETKTLKVNYSYTKCGPFQDLLVAPLSDVAVAKPGPGATPTSGGGPSVRAFKLTSFNGKAILDKRVCVTSQGPWNATFIEERKCSPVTPQDTLIINAFGDQVIFQWSGGTPNHPPSVQLVSCRDVGTIRSLCGISSCDCQSSSCPPTQPCTCTLQGW